MSIATCDLHTHSFYSDGTFSPSELVAMAERLHLGAIALCDHNTVAGLEEFCQRAQNSTVKAVPGIEITAEYDGREVHILGLFIKPCTYGEISAFTRLINQRKKQSTFDLYLRLKAAGYAFDYDEILRCAGSAMPNRAHIADVLHRHGYISSITEGFNTLLKEGNGFYVPAKRIDALDVTGFLSSHNALPVLAHPLLNLDCAELEEFLPKAKSRGLVGMETDYSTFTYEDTQKMRALADEMGLLHSGSSDFHGERKKGIHLGIGKGDLAVPMEYYHKLKEYDDALQRQISKERC